MISLLVSVLVAGVCWAAIPEKISFQGYLEESGTPVTGAKSLELAIFDVPTGGVELWKSGTITVNLDNGFFTAILEAGSPDIATLPFDEPYYLSINIEGQDVLTSQGQRQQLTTAPYAMTARAADSLTSGDKTIDGSVTINDALMVNHSGQEQYALRSDVSMSSALAVYGRVDGSVTGSSALYGFISSGSDNKGVQGYVFGGTDNKAVYGHCPDTGMGYAGYFDGDVKITGGMTLNGDDLHAYNTDANFNKLNAYTTDNNTYAVRGYATGTNSYAGQFLGAVTVSKGLAVEGAAKAVVGESNSADVDDSAGVFGYGGSDGDYGVGVFGIGRYGVKGITNVPASITSTQIGVYGRVYENGNAITQAEAEDQVVAGVRGYGEGYATGVRGKSIDGIGVHGESNTGTGVYGETGGGTYDYGVYGKASGSAKGVYGENTSSGIGVYGKSNSGRGVEGYSSSGHGIYGYSGSGYSGYFSGGDGVYISGDLQATGSKNFVIDHPLDPENKILRHSAIEAPAMKNIYDGAVVLDAKGEAVVALPEYFEALNRDFLYQLTAVGDYAPIYVKEEIKDNAFVIAGGKPGMKVCWLVTGIRNDAYAASHPLKVEEEKSLAGNFKSGEYLNPDLDKVADR